MKILNGEATRIHRPVQIHASCMGLHGFDGVGYLLAISSYAYNLHYATCRVEYIHVCIYEYPFFTIEIIATGLMHQ